MWIASWSGQNTSVPEAQDFLQNNFKKVIKEEQLSQDVGSYFAIN